MLSPELERSPRQFLVIDEEPRSPGEDQFSYFTIAVRKQNNQGNLQKQMLILGLLFQKAGVPDGRMEVVGSRQPKH